MRCSKNIAAGLSLYLHLTEEAKGQLPRRSAALINSMDRACCEHMRPSVRVHRAHVHRSPALLAACLPLACSHTARRCRQCFSLLQPEAAHGLRSKRSSAAAAARVVSAPRPLALTRSWRCRAMTRCSGFSADSVGPLHKGEEGLRWPPVPPSWRTPRGLALAVRRGACEGAPHILPGLHVSAQKGLEETLQEAKEERQWPW